MFALGRNTAHKLKMCNKNVYAEREMANIKGYFFSLYVSHLHIRTGITCHDRSSLQKFNIFEVTKPFI